MQFNQYETWLAIWSSWKGYRNSFADMLADIAPIISVVIAMSTLQMYHTGNVSACRKINTSLKYLSEKSIVSYCNLLKCDGSNQPTSFSVKMIHLFHAFSVKSSKNRWMCIWAWQQKYQFFRESLFQCSSTSCFNIVFLHSVWNLFILVKDNRAEFNEISVMLLSIV